MKGLTYKKIGVVHEDERRSLIEIINGEFIAKQIKLIKVKADRMILGNHYHPFRQFFYLFQGRAEYTFENVDTREREVIKMFPGDLITIDKRIAHKAIMQYNTITLEGNEEPYTGKECDVSYELG